MIFNYQQFISESQNQPNKWSNRLDKITEICEWAHSKAGLKVHPRLLIETAMTESNMGTLSSNVSASWWQIDPPSYRASMATPELLGLYLYRYSKDKWIKKILEMDSGKMKQVLKSNGLDPNVDNLREVFKQKGKPIKKSKRLYNTIMSWNTPGGRFNKYAKEFAQRVDLTPYKYSDLKNNPKVGALYALRHYYAALGREKLIELNEHGNRQQRAYIWKKHYNTSQGKGSAVKYLAKVKYYYTLCDEKDNFESPDANTVAKVMGYPSARGMINVIKKAGSSADTIRANLNIKKG